MRQKRFSFTTGIIMLVLALIITLFGVNKLNAFLSRNESNKPEEIRRAILNACVQCYALEGSYPPDLDYLEAHYGITLNDDKYYFYYEVFASNVMPDVEVYEK
mgnify:CR=1 FL=1|jgi:hypothetical protein